MSVRRSLALARHAFHTNLMAPFTWTGGILLFVVALLGPVISLKNHGVWGFDSGLLGTGFAFGALFVFRSGLAEQRTGGLQAFLRENFVTPLEHVTGAVLSLLATWIAFSVLAFLVGLLLSGGDAGLAAWTVWLLLLTTGMLLPPVLMVESVSDLRTPLFVPGFVYVAAIFTMAGLLGSQRTAEIMALNSDRSWPPSSLPLATRTAVALGAGLALVLAGTWLRSRRRARRRRAAETGVDT